MQSEKNLGERKGTRAHLGEDLKVDEKKTLTLRMADYGKIRIKLIILVYFYKRWPMAVGIREIR